MASERILLVGALGLFLLSIGFGLFYDGLILPARHQSLQYKLDMALNMAAKGDIAMASAFAGQFGSEDASRTIQARIPLHLAAVGAIAAVSLWISPRLDASERMKRVLALFIIGGGGLMAAGDLLRAASPASMGLLLLLGGYAWLALGISGYLLYAVLSIWLQDDKPRTRRR